MGELKFPDSQPIPVLFTLLILFKLANSHNLLIAETLTLSLNLS